MKVKILKPYKQVDTIGTHEATLLIDGEEIVLREDLANCIRYILINNSFEELDYTERTPLVKKVIQLLNEHPLDEFDDFPFLDFLKSDVEFLPNSD
jgi:hypothetical protein